MDRIPLVNGGTDWWIQHTQLDPNSEKAPERCRNMRRGGLLVRYGFLEVRRSTVATPFLVKPCIDTDRRRVLGRLHVVR